MNLRENIERVKKLMNLLNEDENPLDNEYPVPIPSQYKGKNGNLSSSELATPKDPLGKEHIKMYEGYNVRQLSVLACEAFEKMEKKFYEETGILIGESFNWGYRNYDTQFNWVDWDWYFQTGIYKRIPMGGAPHTVDIARPGTSNHGMGTAIDIGGPVQNWLMQRTIDLNQRNGEVFGWWWGEAPSESWHFTFSEDLYEKNKSLRGDSDFVQFDLEMEDDVEAQKFNIKNDIPSLLPSEKYTDLFLNSNKFDNPNLEGGKIIEPVNDD